MRTEVFTRAGRRSRATVVCRTIAPASGWARTGARSAAILATLAFAAGLTACVLDTRATRPRLAVRVTAPIAIPPGQAHVVLQDGRIANASNRLEPWCELEVRTLASAEPTLITGGSFQVSRISSRLLLDPTTRIPVVFVATSCADPLFQEGVWWLSSSAPSDVMYLRCIAPYDNCALGPPLPPDQVQRQVGRYLAFSEEAPFPGGADRRGYQPCARRKGVPGSSHDRPDNGHNDRRGRRLDLPWAAEPEALANAAAWRLSREG